MEKEKKISKVAICPKCNCFVLACHIDHLNRKVEKQFTELTNEGFIILIETGEETRTRGFSSYEDCINNFKIK